jgi:serine/threonine protein kinase
VSAASEDVKSIFGHAMALSSATERAAYLQQACAGDPELRAEVESLLQANSDAGSFLGDRKPWLAATVDHTVTECPGTIIGPYKLMEQIGEGGMGLVFVAEQQHPVRRKVALKVIKPGMDTRQVVARFEAERQALALMDHPHIAKVYDGGMTDGEPAGVSPGRPYFVMELVRGVSITEYCDQCRLTTKARLALFIDVCHAVQHAHQKGIIHRDIKPSNVLVTVSDGAPVVKVIDFGVAKAIGQQLTDKTVYTAFTQMIGTPLYMSPEQADMSSHDVDTRSDIYSLGVLLYELLTGTTPFEQARLRQVPFDELRRIIREEEPPKPSERISTLAEAARTVSSQRQSNPGRLGQLLRGALDWIVIKAMAKARGDRYATAQALADDVQRFLDDRPIQARPPSLVDHVRRWSRRHKYLVRAGAVVLGLAVAALALGAVLLKAKNRELAEASEQEHAQRLRADANFGRARKVVESFFSKVSNNPKLKAVDFHPLRKELLASAVPFYEEFVKEVQDDPDLECDRARAYGQLGRVRHMMAERQEALADYQQARAIFARLADSHPDRPDFRRLLGQSHSSVGNIFMELGRFSEAESAFRESCNVLRALAEENPSEPKNALNLADSASNLGIALFQQGQPQQAEAAFREVLHTQQNLAERFPAEPEYRQRLAGTYLNLGNLLGLAGEPKRPRESEEAFREGVKVLESLAADFPKEPEYREALARGHHNLGELLRSNDKVQEAESHYRAALKILGPLASEFSTVPKHRYELALNHYDLGRLLAATKRPQEAEAAFQNALRLYEPLAQAFPEMAEYQSELGETLADLALLQRDQGKLAEAKKLLEQAVTRQQAAHQARPKNSDYAELLAHHHEHLAEVLVRLQDHAAAAQEVRHLVRLRPHDGPDLYDAACLLSQCVAVAEQDPNLAKDSRMGLTQGYGQEAVRLLREAVAHGYQNAKHLKTDKDLDSLRRRPDYQKLVAELDAKQPK